ncbi:MAG: hypothetical protein ACPF9K_06560 [Neptuniibacter sp.]
MVKNELVDFSKNRLIRKVRLIESGCSPLVIEVEYGSDKIRKELLKTEDNQVLSFKNISQAYDVCRDAGIHEAELVQVIPHDEACAGQYLSYDQQAMTLRF